MSSTSPSSSCSPPRTAARPGAASTGSTATNQSGAPIGRGGACISCRLPSVADSRSSRVRADANCVAAADCQLARLPPCRPSDAASIAAPSRLLSSSCERSALRVASAWATTSAASASSKGTVLHHPRPEIGFIGSVRRRSSAGRSTAFEWYVSHP